MKPMFETQGLEIFQFHCDRTEIQGYHSADVILGFESETYAPVVVCTVIGGIVVDAGYPDANSRKALNILAEQLGRRQPIPIKTCTTAGDELYAKHAEDFYEKYPETRPAVGALHLIEPIEVEGLAPAASARQCEDSNKPAFQTQRLDIFHLYCDREENNKRSRSGWGDGHVYLAFPHDLEEGICWPAVVCAQSDDQVEEIYCHVGGFEYEREFLNGLAEDQGCQKPISDYCGDDEVFEQHAEDFFAKHPASRPAGYERSPARKVSKEDIQRRIDALAESQRRGERIADTIRTIRKWAR